jgi:hypothetical protein
VNVVVPYSWDASRRSLTLTRGGLIADSHATWAPSKPAHLTDDAVIPFF